VYNQWFHGHFNTHIQFPHLLFFNLTVSPTLSSA
jgi:hypothetical protein